MSVLNVLYAANPEMPVPVGRLAMHRGRIYFEYDAAFLQSGLELSPFRLPLKPVAVTAEPAPWQGLFGLFSDSLPDGWGLLLMDRHLRSLGVDTRYLTPLDRLAYIGHRAMGALIYEPATGIAADSPEIDLAAMAASAIEVYEGHASDLLPRLARAGGSPAGARPKILVHLLGERLLSGEIEPPAGCESWVVKFFSGREHADTGRIEYAYSLMAREAGIEMPPTRLFDDGEGHSWFGVRRFDRQGAKRMHMHTLGGLVDADFRLPSLDYVDLLKVTRALTRNAAEVERAFALMAFNVLAHNRDDHSKNFSYLMDEHGEWRLAPAYDLTCSTGINGEHTTAVAGEGRNPGVAEILKAGEAVGLKAKHMRPIVDRVRNAIERWPDWCEQAGIRAAEHRFPPLLHH